MSNDCSALALSDDLDATALSWLDRLMDLPAPAQAAQLALLAAQRAPLHARLQRMLAACAAAQDSRVLHAPLLPAPPTPALQGGACLGGYRLLRELGRGGMAVVWLAERTDGLLQREVALKTPLHFQGNGVDRERFEREREVLARLNHPQIARVFDAGTAADGQPFIVMECVAGQPITAACSALGLRQRLQLFQQVLAAVGHAHQHLVVHRDLKPSNILVDARGQVKLLDFGIAKLLGADAALTHDQGCAMTPRYAAPEQLRGEPVTTATDIYALGVVLYELVTGQPPYARADAGVAQWMHAVLHEEPVAPGRRLAHGFGADLDTLVLKALQKAPAERYSSVERFADDLQRLLEHRALRARPCGLLHRGRLLLRRHRATAAAAGLGLLAALALAGAAWQQQREAAAQRLRADTVREFMFDMVDDAQADEHLPQGEPTGRQMVQAAVDRAQSRFAQQPRLLGEVLGELGRMQARLGDAAASKALLQQAMGLLQAHAEPGDAALNKARAHRAAAAWEDGEVPTAEALATQALQQCRSGRECAKARVYANTVLSQVALLRGQPLQALAQMRQAAADSDTGFGPEHSETALNLLGLAVVARQAARLSEAQQALQRAEAISRQATLRRSDRAELQWLQAVLAHDLGDADQARQRLRALLQAPGSDEEAASYWRLLAQVELSQDDATAAQRAAQAALAGAAAGSVEDALARQALAQAWARQGLFTGAQAQMAQVLAGLRHAGYAEGAMELLRARRLQADITLRAGDALAALRELLAVVQAQRASAGQELELAQTCELLGLLQSQLGHPEQAAPWHREAQHLLQALLPAQHPLRLRNAQRLQALAPVPSAGDS